MHVSRIIYCGKPSPPNHLDAMLPLWLATPALLPQKTGVLCHGCHLQADEWERVVWGDPASGSLGRVPATLRIAQQEQACAIVFGTGASKDPQTGELESVRTLALARERCANGGLRRDFPSSFDSRSAALSAAQLDSVRTDTKSLDTRSELREAAKIFKELGVTRVVLVSSPTHLPRCLRDAEAIFASERFLRHGVLLGAPSGTS